MKIAYRACILKGENTLFFIFQFLRKINLSAVFCFCLKSGRACQKTFSKTTNTLFFVFCCCIKKTFNKKKVKWGECQQSLLTFPPSSSTSLPRPLIYGSGGVEVGSPCLVLASWVGVGTEQSSGLGHKLMKVSNLDTPVNQEG